MCVMVYQRCPNGQRANIQNPRGHFPRRYDRSKRKAKCRKWRYLQALRVVVVLVLARRAGCAFSAAGPGLAGALPVLCRCAGASTGTTTGILRVCVKMTC